MNYKIEKDWIAYGLRCVAIAITDRRAHRCGYVGVPKGHPLYRMDYSKPCELLADLHKEALAGPMGKRDILAVFVHGDESSPDVVFNVHGGITYSGEGEYPVKSDLWWFGFDCAHDGDTPDPTLCANPYRSYPDGTVRTLDYVVSECESLAEQLASVKVEARNENAL